MKNFRFWVRYTLERLDLNPWSWNLPSCRETAQIQVKQLKAGLNMDGKENDTYVECRRGAAMEVGSPCGLQSSGDVGV